MKKILLIGLLAASSVIAKEPLKQKSVSLQAVTAEMTTAAKAFVGSLDEAQAKKAQFPFDGDQRENWGFVPRERKGLPLEDLNEEQIGLVRDLLKTALSDGGLEKVDAIRTLEAFLSEIEKNPGFRNPKAYFTSIFGEPSATGTWSWRFEGHHIALNYTIVEGKAVAVTPSFFAANPGEVTQEHKLKGFRPFHAEEDFARGLATSLKESGKEVIYSDKPPGDILTGEERRVKQLEPVGIKAAEMTAAQQNALMDLVAVYAKRHRDELAEIDIAKVKADVENLRFGWAGGIKRGEPYYYRIQGTTFLVEVANVQNGGNHFHSVWRDSGNDFGRDLLGAHIKDER